MLLLLLLSSVFVLPTVGMVEVPEPGGYEEAGWVDDAAGADPPTLLRYTVRLRESNLPRLRAAALAVSDPASPRYGKFLTGEQIADMTAPSREHLASTLHWVRGERGCGGGRGGAHRRSLDVGTSRRRLTRPRDPRGRTIRNHAAPCTSRRPDGPGGRRRASGPDP